MRHAIRAMLALLLLGSLAAACGGDDGGGNVTAASSTTASANEGTSSSSADLGSGGGEFCDKARGQLAGALDVGSPVVQSILAGMMNPATAEATRQRVRELVQSNEALIDDAPSEIRASMETTLGATQSILTMLEAANFDLSKVDVTKIAAVMSDPKVADATKELETYFKDRCGFDLGSVADEDRDDQGGLSP